DCLDTLYSRRTFRFLDATGIGPGWRCLEIGGGSGSVAAWMAERVGPSGSVLVTDIEPRFIGESHCQKLATVVLRPHDTGSDPPPEAGLVLIRARLVLMHVPQRPQALERIARALKPGGGLVIEDFEVRLIDRTIPAADAPGAALFNRMLSSF